MIEANKNNSNGRNNNFLIVTITVVVLVLVFMYFRDRQQKRALELQRLDTQMELLQEWEPHQNTQLNSTPARQEKIL